MDGNKITLALAGNPNVGKSTVFNQLTGLKQHTGNWTGKTVENAHGSFRLNGTDYTLVDLPGTYSILSSSAEEELARDFIAFGGADGIIVVADATALERNLNLLLQILEITRKVVLCVNLIDEAARKKIVINYPRLSGILGIPVIAVSAAKKQNLHAVPEAFKNIDSVRAQNGVTVRYGTPIEEAIAELIPPLTCLFRQNNLTIDARFVALKLLSGEKNIIKSIEKHININVMSDITLKNALESAQTILSAAGINESQVVQKTVSALIAMAEEIAKETVCFFNADYAAKDRKIDKILTSKKFGFPIMILLLGIVFFITIELANLPSKGLAFVFGRLEVWLNSLFGYIKAPEVICGIMLDGIYKTTAWIVSVMLPPMAIFFPLFTLLEDLGYLPRVAFNLDNAFKKCGCNGKQSLCMCMGFGCNAAGVVGARIIDSPRERLIAIITNNFVPCNGRFPSLIAISAVFIGGAVANTFLSGIVSALCLTAMIMLGIAATLAVSKLLSKTLLKGTPSSFSLELPPYRKPQIGKILWRSLFDRTARVLWRAVKVAVPAGALIWVLANARIDDYPLLYYMNRFFEPLGRLMGLDGGILTAFLLGFPANEIVIPLTLMTYSGSGSLTDFASIGELGGILRGAGWTALTGVNMLIFTLFHFPCATTCLTIKKETNSLKWTLVSIILPTVIGIIACITVTGIVRLFMLI